MEFVFKSKAPGEKARLLAAFENFALENRLPPEVQRAADLAIEEHLTNILSYGFIEPNEHEIQFHFELKAGELSIEIADNGKAFDPTIQPAPDLTVPADQRAIGGLGIHMIRKSMDALEYRRENGRNVLRMRKRLKG